MIDGQEVWFVRHPSLAERGGRQGGQKVERQGTEAGADTPDTGTLLCLISFDSSREGGVTFREERKEPD